MSARKGYLLLAAILLLPALLTNLGVMVFIDDEAIRSLVAQEMRWSGNYLVPTMHGDAYLNKPPGWNWVLALSFYLHGGANEWAARLPTVLSLLGFAATTYAFGRRPFGRYLAVVHALTVITCGRMLFWDSMLALIDVCFSWVVYTQVMLLYHYGRAGRWWRAFGWTYALTAAAFMLKGLPAFVFQGLTVLSIVGWCRDWKQLIRPAHLVSGLGCLALLSLYYLPYGQRVDLLDVATRLFAESSKRTAAAHPVTETVAHLLSFPFAMAYHFLPWTLLLVFLLRRGAWSTLKTNDFAAFCLVAFLVNLPIYWVSPNVYPRYLLMLFPLLFAAGLYLHQQHARRRTPTYRYLRVGLLGVMTVVSVAICFIPLIPPTAIVYHAWPLALGLGGVAGAITWVAWRDEANWLLLLCCFLLVLRIVFNVFLLPPRAADDERGIAVRDSARRVAGHGEARPLRIYRYTLIEPATGYYLSMAYGKPVRRDFADYLPDADYIGSPLQYPDLRIEATDSLYLRHLRTRYPVGPLRFPLPTNPTDPTELKDGMGSGLTPKS